MDKINFRFLDYKTYNSFKTALNDGRILDDSIVFIKDKRCIWARGREYICDGPYTTNTDDSGNVTLTKGDGTLILRISQQNGVISITDSEGNVSTSTYATKKYVDDNIASKQDKLQTGKGIKIIDNVISTDINIDTSIYVIVDELPLVDANENKIYLLRKSKSSNWVFGDPLPAEYSESTGDGYTYTQYKWNNQDKQWVKIGDVSPTIDLSEYVQRYELENHITYCEDRYLQKQLVYAEDGGIPGTDNPGWDPSDDVGITTRSVVNTVFLTKEQYDALVRLDLVKENVYYFTYESDEGNTQSNNWTFGGTFPITLT